MSDRALSNAYLRLRALIPGAYDTPNAPSPEQVWETTEAALRRLLHERADARIRHPLTNDTWVLDGRTGRVKEVVTDDVEQAREERIRREERERCAQHIEARACQLRDHGPTSPEGLLRAIAGAQVGALLDAAASLRATRDAP